MDARNTHDECGYIVDNEDGLVWTCVLPRHPDDPQRHYMCVEIHNPRRDGNEA